MPSSSDSIETLSLTDEFVVVIIEVVVGEVTGELGVVLRSVTAASL